MCPHITTLYRSLRSKFKALGGTSEQHEEQALAENATAVVYCLSLAIKYWFPARINEGTLKTDSCNQQLERAVAAERFRREIFAGSSGKGSFLVELLRGSTSGKLGGFDAEVRKAPETIAFLSSTARAFPEVLLANWDDCVLTYLREVFLAEDKKKTVAAIRVLEEWLKPYTSDAATAAENVEDAEIELLVRSVSHDEESKEQSKKGYEEEKEEHFAEKSSPFDKESFVVAFSEWTKNYITGSEGPEIKISMLNILSMLQEAQWAALPAETVSLIVKQASTFESPPALKAASLKFYGHLVYLPRFCTDPNFIKTSMDRFFGTRLESNTNVCNRNSWAVANVCCSPLCLARLTQKQLAQVIQIAQVYNESHKEKVIANAVRAFGYILSSPLVDIEAVLADSAFAPESSGLGVGFRAALAGSSDKRYGPRVDELIELLIIHLGNKSAKITWNACVSLGNVVARLEQEEEKGKTNKVGNASSQGVQGAFDAIKKLLYSARTLKPLSEIISERSNYKTRIHAAQTLLRFNRVEQFGNYYFGVWEHVLEAIENTSTVNEYSEFKYIETLEYILVKLLAHLVQVVRHEG